MPLSLRHVVVVGDHYLDRFYDTDTRVPFDVGTLTPSMVVADVRHVRACCVTVTQGVISIEVCTRVSPTRWAVALRTADRARGRRER
jgi:hypothetical protein